MHPETYVYNEETGQVEEIIQDNVVEEEPIDPEVQRDLMRECFEKHDGNGDGVLNYEEFKRFSAECQHVPAL